MWTGSRLNLPLQTNYFIAWDISEKWGKSEKNKPPPT